MAHPPRSKPPLRSSSGPPNPCITPSTETLVVVVNLMSWSPPHVHMGCAHEARIASRRRGVLSEGQSTCWMRLRSRARSASGSSPWSNSRLDLVHVLAPVVGPQQVERAGLIQPSEQLIRQRRHELIGLLRD